MAPESLSVKNKMSMLRKNLGGRRAGFGGEGSGERERRLRSSVFPLFLDRAFEGLLQEEPIIRPVMPAEWAVWWAAGPGRSRSQNVRRLRTDRNRTVTIPAPVFDPGIRFCNLFGGLSKGL